MGCCGDCRWWQKESEKLLSKGACIYGPPSVNFFGKTIWPKTHSTDGCAHFKNIKDGEVSVPKYDLAKTDDKNIVNTIPNSAGYKLLRCRLRTAADDQWSKMRAPSGSLRTGAPYNKDRSQLENLSIEEDLVISELELLGWLVVVDNGPFAYQLSNNPFIDCRVHKEVGVPRQSHVKLIPITLSDTFISTGYRLRIIHDSRQITYDGIVLPGERDVTALDGSSVPIPLELFKENALRNLVRKNNEAAELKKHEESSENN